MRRAQPSASRQRRVCRRPGIAVTVGRDDGGTFRVRLCREGGATPAASADSAGRPVRGRPVRSRRIAAPAGDATPRRPPSAALRLLHPRDDSRWVSRQPPASAPRPRPCPRLCHAPQSIMRPFCALPGTSGCTPTIAAGSRRRRHDGVHDASAARSSPARVRADRPHGPLLPGTDRSLFTATSSTSPSARAAAR